MGSGPLLPPSVTVPPQGYQTRADILHPATLTAASPRRAGSGWQFGWQFDWRRLRLLSSRNNTYNRDYHAETPDGEHAPILNVFTRDGGGFRHWWATELMFAPRDEGEDPRHVDLIWPIWNVLDMTPAGRGEGDDLPAMQYE